MNALIFDIDGTLTNTTKVDDECFIKAFKTIFGIDISNQNWAELTNVTDWGITEEIVLKNWNRIPNEIEYDKMMSEFISLLKRAFQTDEKQFQEIDGASNFIRLLKQKPNTVVAIATGGWEKSAIFKLKSIGIDSTEFAFSNSTLFKKREDILYDTIQQLNKQNDNKIKKFIYFGDGTWDLITCQKLGIEFIGIDNSKNNRLKNLGAKITISDFKKPESIFYQLGI